MSEEYKLEDPGEGITEAEVAEILVSEGDEVKDGDPLLTVETDKAANEIPAGFSGKIDSVNVSEGETIKVGQVLVTYTASGSPDEQASENEGQESKQKARKDKDEDKEKEKDKDNKDKDRDENKSRDTQKDRDEEEDEHKDSDEETSGAREEQEEQGEQQSGRPVPAAPATRQLAREQHVDLREVEGSGPGGRVTKEDVRAHSKGPAAGQSAPDDTAQAVELPDFSQWGKTRREPLQAVRRAIARNMSISWSQIPHVMHQSVADITELERFRQRHQEDAEQRAGKLTMTVLMIKALVAALKRFPRFNASLDTANNELVFKEYYDIGVAVATDAGLLVPVIREADRKDVLELATDLAALADKAREGELRKEDMEGATFSLTNPGPIGATSFSPIIHHPEVAILGMGSAALEPVARGTIDHYKLEARLRMPLCLGYDHRVNDGADAANFLKAIVDLLEDPETFLISV